MTELKSDEANLNNVRIKMPEEDFFQSEPEVKSHSLMPLVIFGLILVLISTLGGLIWWGLELKKTMEPEISVVSRPAVEIIEPLEAPAIEVAAPSKNTEVVAVTPNELQSIQSDLASTTVDNLTDGVRTIDIILQADYQ